MVMTFIKFRFIFAVTSGL